MAAGLARTTVQHPGASGEMGEVEVAAKVHLEGGGPASVRAM